MRRPWSLPCWPKENLAPCKHNSSRCSCSDLVPLGMKWACTCAGTKDVGHSQWSVLLVCWLGLLYCCVGSTFDDLGIQVKMGSSERKIVFLKARIYRLWVRVRYRVLFCGFQVSASVMQMRDHPVMLSSCVRSPSSRIRKVLGLIVFPAR